MPPSRPDTGRPDTPAVPGATVPPGVPSAPGPADTDEVVPAATADSAAVRIGETMHRISHRLRRRHVPRLSPLGLTPAQERALRMVASAPAPLRMVELADRLGIVPRSATTLVDALEQAGLVRRTPDPSSRRSTLLLLTDAGRDLQQRMRQARREVFQEAFAPLSPGEREQLLELLQRVAAGLDGAACHRDRPADGRRPAGEHRGAGEQGAGERLG
ncbi:MarR family winged helix-turn-helix transcriptional regulator [Allostreptomyces psammosilenae]|uniref:DNA-binding MarR family transcriptional regulator n=1 Tax=Allostreptomyces psammosilenae TaxID=1892865 RepID=A0A852ZT38_9ACTN|nr:MarR family transcriptional regulator [Allostreptomyces psammosilenae]NYI04430.1 DNA-binding MarR family transcriptional regulator [Allostreptomyces psammosilenae]